MKNIGSIKESVAKIEQIKINVLEKSPLAEWEKQNTKLGVSCDIDATVCGTQCSGRSHKLVSKR